MVGMGKGGLFSFEAKAFYKAGFDFVGFLRKPFVVQCDACGSSIGAVLMQDGHVVTYESRVLLKIEKSLQIYEKDLLAIIHALSTWKHYLLGSDFVMCRQIIKHFDISSLKAKLSNKHMRWVNFLSIIHFQIVHVDGKKNVVVDALSRKPHVSTVSIVFHDGLDLMWEQYTQDEEFCRDF